MSSKSFCHDFCNFWQKSRQNVTFKLFENPGLKPWAKIISPFQGVCG